MNMDLKDRVVILSEENLNGLRGLYENFDTNDLERIVNKHIAVAISEIREDTGKTVSHCKGCGNTKCKGECKNDK